MEKHVLSKSTFIRGLKCHKSLYLNKHQKQLRDQLSEMQLAIFEQGNKVGELAQNLFPGGIDCTSKSYFDFSEAITKTNDLIKNGQKVIYEAAFQYNGILAILDILVKDEEGWKAYEVKSSTSVSTTHVMDATLQSYVIQNSGLELVDVSIVYINNQYKRKGDLNIKELFSTSSIHEKVLEKMTTIPSKIIELKKVLNKSETPNVDIGPHCTSPYNCDFIGHCWKHIPDYSIFDISNLNQEKKFELYNNGIVDFKDIPNDFQLSKNQKTQIQCELDDKTIMDQTKLSTFINDLKYPLYYLDFETFSTAVPLFDNTKPYQQMVFQYSLHVNNSKHSSTLHFEYLAKNDGSDPREEFVKQLINDCKTEGDILVYNISFEKSRLKELINIYPHYRIPLEKIIFRLKDLMVPFQKKWYYSKEMKGSYSIKKVLPALSNELNYTELEIQDGGLASHTFTQLITSANKKNEEDIRKNLLEYCKMDTLAMVKIVEKLNALF